MLLVIQFGYGPRSPEVLKEIEKNYYKAINKLVKLRSVIDPTANFAYHHTDYAYIYARIVPELFETIKGYEEISNITKSYN